MNKHKVGRLLNSVRTEWEKIRPQNLKLVRVENADDASSPTKVYLYNYIGGFDGVTARMVVDELDSLEGELELHINSGGGDLFEGVAIYNAFKNYGGKVVSYIDGVAASAASFVAMAGDEVIIEKNATMMIHDGQGMVIGNAQDMFDAGEILNMLSDTIAEMYADKTGESKEDIRTLMKAETWFNAEEAVELGLADKINGEEDGSKDTEETAAATNRLDLKLFSYKNSKNGPRTSTGPHDDLPEAFDVDGLRDALKGAFA